MGAARGHVPQGESGGSRIAERLRAQAANGVTLLRVVATPAFGASVWSAHQGHPSPLPALIFFVAVASDLGDGPLARRLGIASDRGRILDHVADITFITSALAVYWKLGIAPWWVPAAIAASFLVYVVDSWRLGVATAPRRLVGSRLGHVAGILNYVLVGVLACNESAGLHWLPAGLTWALFAAVPLYSGGAAISRLRGRGEQHEQ